MTKYVELEVPWVCPKCGQQWFVDVSEGASLDDLEGCPACMPELMDIESVDCGEIEN